MKKILVFMGLAFLSGVLCIAKPVKAASANIQFSMEGDQPQVGDTVTVVCKVSSTTAFQDVNFNVFYDKSILKFATGGSKVSGKDGTLTIASTENSTTSYKKTFSLQFKAKKAGTSMISVGNLAEVTDEKGASLSISSNRLSVSVLKKGQKVGDVAEPGTNPQSGKVGDASLQYLETSGVQLAPQFSPSTTKYTVLVPYDRDTIFFDYRAADANASVTLEGNNDLKVGANQVVLTVRPQNGNSKRYFFTVTRETEAETSLREIKEGKKAISVKVTSKDGKVVIENQYQFQVLDPAKAPSMPKGYVLTKVTIDNVEVPAYTKESKLDSEFLLLYLQGPNGTSNIYQYDRQEQTLQRYTGEITANVYKKESANQQNVSSTQITVLFIVVIVLMTVVLALLAVLLKMVTKMRKLKKKQDYHELDF